MRYWGLIVVGSGLISGSVVVHAEEIAGAVRLFGSALQSQTLVVSAQEQAEIRLCPSETEQRIRHLTDLRVVVTGTWQLTKQGERDCFVPKAFSVTKVASGRDAIVGVLSRQGDYYAVKADDGRETKLMTVPDGLRSLVGQRVILDVRSMGSSLAVDAPKVVVSYQSSP